MGGTYFWQRLPGGVPKFYGNSEGGMRFLRALFPYNTTPPPNKNSEQSLGFNDLRGGQLCHKAKINYSYLKIYQCLLIQSILWFSAWLIFHAIHCHQSSIYTVEMTHCGYLHKDYCTYHEFHETCHSVTFVVLVNSHQQTWNRICPVVGTNWLVRWSVINDVNVSVNKLIRYFHFH